MTWSGSNAGAFAVFNLAAPIPSLDLTGNYLVTLTADTACTTLPSNAMTRSYTATISRSPSSIGFVGRLGGATFATPGTFARYDTFYAYVFGTVVRFAFWADDETNGFVEQLGSEAYLGIGGDAVATFDSSSIDVPFSGVFDYCPGARASGSNVFACAATPISCNSENHRLAITRQ